MNTLITISLLGLAFLSLFLAGETMKHIFDIKVEWTRKFIHTSTGMLSMVFPLLFNSHQPVLLLCSSFLGLLLFSKRKSLLSSINGVSRKTYGALLFPVSVYLCFVIQNMTGKVVHFYLPILILSLSDPLAALVGQRLPVGIYRIMNHKKTLSGSFAFFISAFVLSILYGYDASQAIFLGLIATLSEAVSKDGWDNLSIPLTILLGMLFINGPVIC